MPEMEEQKVADDSNAVTSHVWAQWLQAISPTVEHLSAHCFGALLMSIKEVIPRQQDSRLVGKLATQSLLGCDVPLHGSPKSAPKAHGRRWVWTSSTSDTRGSAFPIVGREVCGADGFRHRQSHLAQIIYRQPEINRGTLRIAMPKRIPYGLE